LCTIQLTIRKHQQHIPERKQNDRLSTTTFFSAYDRLHIRESPDEAAAASYPIGEQSRVVREHEPIELPNPLKGISGYVSSNVAVTIAADGQERITDSPNARIQKQDAARKLDEKFTTVTSFMTRVLDTPVKKVLLEMASDVQTMTLRGLFALCTFFAAFYAVWRYLKAKKSVPKMMIKHAAGLGGWQSAFVVADSDSEPQQRKTYGSTEDLDKKERRKKKKMIDRMRPPPADVASVKTTDYYDSTGD